MRRWFTLEREYSSDGIYKILRLQSINGQLADKIPAFVTQLADQIWGYATKDNIDIFGRFNTYYMPPANGGWNSSIGVQRLLVKEDGWYKRLMGFTGECLSHWIYQSYLAPVLMTEPKPFSKDPAWDLIAVNNTALPNPVRVECIQAKVTSRYARGSCQEAVDKYTRLHAGDFNMELANELSMLVRDDRIRPLLEGYDWRVVLIDGTHRDYTIFIAYDDVSTSPHSHNAAWARSWRDNIDTSVEHRALVILPLSNCYEFMENLASILRAKTV